MAISFRIIITEIHKLRGHSVESTNSEYSEIYNTFPKCKTTIGLFLFQFKKWEIQLSNSDRLHFRGMNIPHLIVCKQSRAETEQPRIEILFDFRAEAIRLQFPWK